MRVGSFRIADPQILATVCALALARILLVSEINDFSIVADGHNYVATAGFVLEHGRLPELSYQSKGFAILLSGLMAITDHWELIFDQATAIMDLMILVIIAGFAMRFILKRNILLLSVFAIFLQPFTITYIRYLYPDYTCQFFMFLGAMLIWVAFFWHRSMSVLVMGAALLGVAGVVRQDMIPISLFVILSAATFEGIRRPADRGRLARSAMLALAVCAAVPGAVLVWQARSSGEVGFARPSVASNPGVHFSGYSAWLRSWVILERSEHSRFAWTIGAKSWPGFEIEQYPDRAFAGADHRHRVAALLASWQQRGYSDEIDSEFGQLAESNCAQFVGRCSLALPLARMTVLWFNLDSAHAIIAPLNIKRPFSTILVFLTLCLRLSMFALAAYAVWALLTGRLARDARLPLVTICSSVVVLRTIEIGVLGTLDTGISWGGLVEARYMTPVFPFMILLAVLGLSLVPGRRRPEPVASA